MKLQFSSDVLGAASRRSAGLKGSSAGHEVEDENDNGKDQKDVYPAAERIAADQSYDPENEEDNRDSPKHWVDLLS
jgi:hypothetical protein